MIDIDIVKRKKDGQTGSAVTLLPGGGGSTAHSSESDHASRADEATHAASADEARRALVAETVNGSVENAKEAEHAKEADNSKAWGGHAFDDWLDQPVRKGDAVTFGGVTTDDIHSSDSEDGTSLSGKGWTLKNVSDGTGTYSVLAVDDVVVRKKLEAAELEIQKRTYVGGQLVASDWGHKILKVDFLNYNYKLGIGMPSHTSRSTNAFRVFFCESDGTATVEDDLVVGTMGLCQEFNVKARTSGSFTNTYYWGVCVEHGVMETTIGNKKMQCVYGVFAYGTKLLTLTSETSGKTFTCYGMEQGGCTFPVEGDDMVGFGCADPWQDASRSNAIVIASKDGEGGAPSIMAYSGIGRLRGGSVVGTLGTDDTPADYTGLGEQYSLPTGKDDIRLDFRVSKKAGNVFKGDLYFKGDDGTTLRPVTDNETTSVWQLVPVTELAETSYSIDKDKYKSAYESGDGSVSADAVFDKTGKVELQYYLKYQKGEGSPKMYSKLPDGSGLRLTVSAFSEDGQMMYSYSSSDTNVVAGGKLQSLSWSDTSDILVNVARIAVTLLDGANNIVDRREVRMQLNGDGVFAANEKFLAYIYYGTGGDGGTQYTNKHLSTMEGDYSSLVKRVGTAEYGISTNRSMITATESRLDARLNQTDAGLSGLLDSVTELSATAQGIDTKVESLYQEGNLLWGCDVRGLVKKQHQVLRSASVGVKKGLTYTVTARMWLLSKAGSPTLPAMDGHITSLYVHNSDRSWQSNAHYSYTRSGTVIDRLVFTAPDDMEVYVGIYERDGNGGDPKSYGGVAVDWVRLDLGNHADKDELDSWSPAAKDVETQNLLPDPGFSESGWALSAADGATRAPIGDTGFMSLYTADQDEYGFNGVRMMRSGYSGGSKFDGLIYYIPFRGEGDYTVSALTKRLDGVGMNGQLVIELHPCGQDKRRTRGGTITAIGGNAGTDGYEVKSATRHFGTTEARAGDGVEVATKWLEVRVYLTHNGDAVVSRLCVAKSGHIIHWNANALGDAAGREERVESYARQRADEVESGVTNGLKSVGFRMDGASWSVSTWGDKFAWYATKALADKGDTSQASMWLDSQTGTLHVKGYVEATGGKMGALNLAGDGLYQGTLTSAEYAYYAIDSLYIRGAFASSTGSYSYQIKMGIHHAESEATGYSYTNHGLNGCVEFTRSNKGNNNNVDLLCGGPSEGGNGAYYGTNECALGVRCGMERVGYGYGLISIGMLASHRLTVLTGKGSSSVKLSTEGYYVATGAGMTITFPDDPQKGARITILNNTSGRVYFNGNGYKFYAGGDTNATASSSSAGEWDFFLFDGTYWQAAYVKSGRFW